MRPISADDVMGGAEYEEARPALRRRILVLKGKRRVPLGEHATLHFETRETMLYQVHEMLRAEGSWDRPGAVQDELDAYNPLVPGGGALSATLMLEYETAEERAVKLRELLGLDRHLWLQVGTLPPAAAELDRAQVSPTRISSVQYVRWQLDDEARRALVEPGTVVRVLVDHPSYRAQAVLSEETRAELAHDIGG